VKVPPLPLSPPTNHLQMSENPSTVLKELASGDASRREELSQTVYDDMKKVARRHLRASSHPETLRPTALVHEAYLRLIKQEDLDALSKSHFFAIAATAMRQIIVSYHRKMTSEKRGGHFRRIQLDEELIVSPRRGEDVLALEEALEKLKVIDESREQLVVMRFYGGLTVDEAAKVMGVSARTVKNVWASTRAWLRRELATGLHESGP
jgi:RNA polymerase sigma-70 factor (ECF subfamily)